MAIALTLDQRASRTSADRVDDWRSFINDAYGTGLRRPFVRTAGDELQAVLGQAQALADIVAACVVDGGWWIGVGVGRIEHLGQTARDSQGPAFWHARHAVEAAKKRSTPQPVAVEGEPADQALALNDALTALAFIASRRSREQQESIALLRAGMRNKDIAAHLGVTPAAVSQRLRGAGADEEAGIRRLIAGIAARVVTT